MRKLSEDELQQILEQHKLWAESSGVKGNLADLCDVNLEGVDLHYVNLSCIDLQDTNLRDANLRKANLQEVDLRGGDLRGADLQSADLQETDLQEADLRGTKFDHGIFKCFSLAYTKWLKTDIPWYLQHPDYFKWADTIEILDE